MRRLKVQINKSGSLKQGIYSHVKWREGSCQTDPTTYPNSDPFDPKPTRICLTIPATPPVKLGTNLKLEDWPSYRSRHHQRKTTRTSAIQARKPATVPPYSATIFAGFWMHHHLGFVLQVTLIIFRPVESPETAGLAPIGRRKAHGFGSSIRRHRRAW